MSDTVVETTKAPTQLRLGEIFEYKIDNEGEVDTVQAFFIKVDKDYFLITLDEGTTCFFDEIAGHTFEGRQREGHDKFTYLEVLRYLKTREVTLTGRFYVEKKKPVDKSSLSVSLKMDKYTSKPSNYLRNDPFEDEGE